MTASPGLFNTWVFYDEPVTNVTGYVHVVIEHQSKVFSHLNMGVMAKAGTWTGGAYTTGTSSLVGTTAFGQSAHVWERPSSVAQSQGQSWLAMLTTEIHATNTIDAAEASGGTGGGALEFLKSEWIDRHSFTFNALSVANNLLTQDIFMHGIDWRNGLEPTVPIYCVARDATANVRYFLGEPEHVRGCFVEALPSGLNIITIGSDSWYFFPSISSGVEVGYDYTGAGSSLVNSGINGYAYKLIP